MVHHEGSPRVAVGLVYDDVYLKHNTGEHPENGKRLQAVMSHLKETGTLAKLMLIKPIPTTFAELKAVHSEAHINYVKQLSESNAGYLDMDTVVSEGSYETAIYAAGGVIRAVDAVMKGEVTSAFALVRPPGHHATRNRAMGFCLFNNIAIGAKYALSQYKLSRLAVIDTDVHHGNGTQDIFNSNPEVLYVSTHESPLYPGTGGIQETGSGSARGTKVNIPLPAGAGDKEYSEVYEEIVVPVVRRYKPELIMVSAGFDAHFADGLAMLRLSVSGYAEVMQNIKKMADELCAGKIVLSLEGGYNLQALSACVKATFDVLLSNGQVDDPLGRPPSIPAPPDITPIIQAVKKVHNLS